MNLYVKLFLVTGIPYGVLMGFFFGATRGLKVGILSGLLSGPLFGLFMSLVLGTFHKMKTKKISSGPGDDVGPHQSRTITVDTPFESIFEKCLLALGNIKAKVTNTDKVAGTITAKTKMSWKSFGEEIQITVVRDEGSKAKVIVSSAPKLKTTLVDYGKGHQNVTSLMDFINS